ncbi:DUF1285 domain-containing protein [Acinetobacter apis]|uniref:DUF1285 domain-containing protein n=1 Tax=Acinetobacter apis TaxID=1229165 RepID=A0A217EH45_9GAMM|nr:DUF1285 domain-containing protein [Acinetobacter apis]SNQ29825.1 hypothetical protein SAMN05444584_1796 [Acinetobacter apis]
MVNHDIYPELCKKETNSPMNENELQLRFGQLAYDSAYQARLPLDQWQPKHCGEMDLCIRANGEWWHEGRQIHRTSLIQLFSRVLCKEQEQYYLKTPTEKMLIHVEDEALFVDRVARIMVDGKALICLSTTDNDHVVIDETHAPFMRDYQGEMRPYIYIRHGLLALIQRHAFYHLIEEGELIENEAGETILILQSGDFCLHLHS